MSALPEAKALPDPPTDGVSALQYLRNGDDESSSSSLLASTSWDGCVRLHDTERWVSQINQYMDSGPLLSLATMGTMKSNPLLVTGGLDGSIRKLDILTNATSVVGRHSGEPSKVACSCLKSLGENLIVSAGWNSQLHLWDVRSSSQVAIASMDLPGKAFAMDVDESRNRIVVATSAGRRLVFCDFNHGTLQTVLDRESSLKYQTRCVQFFPNGHGIAIGSIEGRVAVEYLPETLLSNTSSTSLDVANSTNNNNIGTANSEKKKYAFKCHRIQDTVYPVNAIAFCPTQDCTFATGGCDGTVAIWDGLHKKKLTSLPKFPTSIAALVFSPTGSHLAIAASYTFEEGERDHPRDEIFVRPVLESEVQPKGK
ncbi:hypothetical protein MHU86_22778 [Fragilaria crotonensis]|nr:hypothetical protein MHU86_22778 [Fragilaria crotonensis]